MGLAGVLKTVGSKSVWLAKSIDSSSYESFQRSEVLVWKYL